MNDDLTKRNDLTDPAVLKLQCEEFAAGLEQQAIASTHRNAFQGHPQPGYFFGRAATVFKAAAAFIAQFEPTTDKGVTTDVPPVTETPAETEAAKSNKRK